jgi:hypothetical protein
MTLYVNAKQTVLNHLQLVLNLNESIIQLEYYQNR